MIMRVASLTFGAWQTKLKVNLSRSTIASLLYGLSSSRRLDVTSRRDPMVWMMLPELSERPLTNVSRKGDVADAVDKNRILDSKKISIGVEAICAGHIITKTITALFE